MRTDPVQHFCHSANPCTFSTTPSYFNWDFVYLDTPFCNSTTPIQVTIGNGVADITFGNGVNEPYLDCCEGSPCYLKMLSRYYFAGKCDPVKNMTLSLWNRNDFEKESITLLFNNGVGPGPN